MTQATKHPIEHLMTTAERAVADLEALEEGVAWAAESEHAGEAVEKLHDAAAGEVFPAVLSPASEATLRDLDGLLRRVVGSSPAAIAAAYIEAHRMAVDGGNDALAAALRSPRGVSVLQDRLELAGRRIVLSRAEAVAAGMAIIEQGVAEQLAGNDAADALGAVAGLRDRIDAARSRHQAHAEAELDRMRVEEAEAEAETQRERQRVVDGSAAEAEEAERRRNQAERRAFLARCERIADELARRSVADEVTVWYGDRSDAMKHRFSVPAIRNGAYSAKHLDSIERAIAVGNVKAA